MRLSLPVAPVAIQTATRLRRQLAAGSQVDASHFWRAVNSLALPLVTAINGADDEREVTFLWRAASPLRGVYVRLNRVTDKDNVAKGMMTQLPTTDIWHLTLRLPASYCGSYTMVEIPPETPDETVLQLGSRFASLVGKADPLNSTPGINVRGNAQESVLALDHAPAQEEWSGCRAYAGQLFTSEHRLAGQRRRVRLYLPDVPVVQPLGLLVLTDGEIWFDHLGVSAAIDAAIRSGRIAPVAVLGIDNINARERVAILGGRRELVLDIAERLLPTLRAKYPERRWADRTQ
ncbi:esterase family protein, partial [Salmonella enterica subsp. enterica serovar Michigan]|nr:esterase family protein [Salmonella enterica subsp. enterica serovar Michigan]